MSLGLTYQIREDSWHIINIFVAKHTQRVHRARWVWGATGWCTHGRCRYRHHTLCVINTTTTCTCHKHHVWHTPNWHTRKQRKLNLLKSESDSTTNETPIYAVPVFLENHYWSAIWFVPIINIISFLFLVSRKCNSRMRKCLLLLLLSFYSFNSTPKPRMYL